MPDPKKTKRPRGNPALVKGGPSLNPGGRPRGAVNLQALVNERTDFNMIVDFLNSVVANPKESTKNRMEASRILQDRGHGKAPQHTTIEATVGAEPKRLNTSAVTHEERALTARVARRMRSTPLLPSGDDS